MLKGTLDMMILRRLVFGEAYGHTFAKVIEQTSEDLGGAGISASALRRLENRG
jgi:PadR family transcriptional regulator, regulatory protein PadR